MNQSQTHKPREDDELPAPVDTYSPLASDASVDESSNGDLSHLLADHVEQVHVYEPDEENDLRKYLSAIPEEEHDPLDITELGVHRPPSPDIPSELNRTIMQGKTCHRSRPPTATLLSHVPIISPQL